MTSIKSAFFNYRHACIWFHAYLFYKWEKQNKTKKQTFYAWHFRVKDNISSLCGCMCIFFVLLRLCMCVLIVHFRAWHFFSWAPKYAIPDIIFNRETHFSPERDKIWFTSQVTMTFRKCQSVLKFKEKHL